MTEDFGFDNNARLDRDRRMCFDLLEVCAGSEGRMDVYRRVMAGIDPCPMAQDCRKGRKASADGRPLLHEQPRQMTLLEAVG